MTLLHLIDVRRLRCLSYRSRRWYSPLSSAPAASPILRAPQNSLLSQTYRPSPALSRTPLRFFAAPVQAKPKPNADAQGGPRLNGAITAPRIRLVTDEGHYIISRWEALDRATKLNLDLVEVQRAADPPVCKIMDFHKEKFKQEEKEKERAKSKSALKLRCGENKEVRFKAKTEAKDLKIKAETVTRLMERGYRVKCTAMPTGKEEEDLGGLLSRLLALIEDVSVVESGPHVDTRQAYVIVRHLKFATKRSGKKVGKVMDTVLKGLQSTIPDTETTISDISENEMPHQSEEEGDPMECVSETINDASSYQAQENIPKETGWAAFDTSDDFRDVFDFDSKNVSESMVSTASHSPSAVTGNKPSHQRPVSASKPGLGSLKTILESKKEPTNVTINTLSEHAIVESNRYSKSSGQKGKFQPQIVGTERDRRGQLDPMQRQFHRNNPTQPPPSYANFSSQKVYGSIDQSNSAGPTRGEHNKTSSQRYGILNWQRTAGDRENPGVNIVDKPGDHNLPSQKYNIFTSPEVNEGNQKNVGGTITGNSGTSSSPPKYGIFYNRGAATSVDQDKVDLNTGKPSTSTPCYGVSAGNQTKVEGGNLNKPSNVSQSTGYGIFSISKIDLSGNKTRPRDASVSEEARRLVSSKNPQGVSKSETESHRQNTDSREGRWGIFSR